MKKLLAVAALAIAAAALAADIKENVSTNYSQPVGGRSPTGTVIPLQATDAGVLRVMSISGDGGMGFEVSGPGGAILVVRSQTADGGTEHAVGGPGGAVLLTRTQTADGGEERPVGGPGGATLIVRAQAADAGAEFGVSGPGGAILVVRAQGADGGESFGVTGPGGNTVVVSGTATVTQGTSRDGGYDWGVNVDNFPASYPVTGTFWQTTQPVSGTFWQTTQPVSGTFWQGTQPVSGTFWPTNQNTIARDGGDEFGVTAPGGGPVFVRAGDGGYEFGVTGAGGNPVGVQASGGYWDSTTTLGDTCTSTGTNATATVPASSYVSGYCTTAAYVGIGSTCASLDGGTIPSCMVRAAKEPFYFRTGAASTTLACISESGTTNCPLFTKSN